MPADRAQYRELARQLRSVHAVNREIARCLPHDCPAASAGLLTLLRTHGEMRMSNLTELLGIDMSVTSRHVAHAAERGWIERHPDPYDGRSRLLRLTESGQEQLEELSARASTMIENRLADWPPSDVATLNTLLGRLRASFGAAHTPEATRSDTYQATSDK
ncbi:MarR family transcriptional regulator [Streptomyces sp. N2-109]|uniref:MarR family transcriptional regulator n=1 Tax=Streptomyces gossypii TaxID=2883101 RepID=A0ABT2JQ32_9ACTN|nr:MarR family transcriptional regulator [Streptomyces gossypii]MCT2589389.1 MarR family transcriptional regulator [Streptomyces gossypii]